MNFPVSKPSSRYASLSLPDTTSTADDSEWSMRSISRLARKNSRDLPRAAEKSRMLAWLSHTIGIRLSFATIAPASEKYVPSAKMSDTFSRRAVRSVLMKVSTISRMKTR